MKRLLALWVTASLFACAAQAPAPDCPTTTVERVLASFAVGGVEPEADLQGVQAEALYDWVASQAGQGLQNKPDRALIFAPSDDAMIVWFAQGCYVGHSQGPTAAILAFLESLKPEKPK